MTVTVTIQSENKLLPGPKGMGAKLVQGYVHIEQYSAALHAKDVHLNTIKAIFFEQYTLGSFIIVSLSAPGTYGNYASLTAYNLSGTGGYAIAQGSNAINAHFVAFGE